MHPPRDDWPVRPPPTRPRWRTRFKRLALRLDEGARLIREAGLFDPVFYGHRNPIVAALGDDPLLHYLEHGWHAGLDPHPLFDTAFYLHASPDVRRAGLNPLVHFVARGAAERRNPCAHFDTAFYLEANPDVARSGTNPVTHYLREGAAQGRDPHPRFHTRFYLARYPDVARSGMNPLVHYRLHGAAEGRRTMASLAHRARPVEPAPGASALERAGHPPPAPVPAITLRVGGVPDPGVAPGVRAASPSGRGRGDIVCVTHVVPSPPRAGNEWRVLRLLEYLQRAGYRVVPVFAPLPGPPLPDVRRAGLAARFPLAVVCDREGRVTAASGEVRAWLRPLEGRRVAAAAPSVDADQPRGAWLDAMERHFCHEAVRATVSCLVAALDAPAVIAEYVWMSRVLAEGRGPGLRIIDTHDVYSTRADKVLAHGIAELHLDRAEEGALLDRADLILAIHDEDASTLRALAPTRRVLTVGVDFDVDAGAPPPGPSVLMVASDNPMNRKGLRDFLTFAWPIVTREVPAARLAVAGTVGLEACHADPALDLVGPVDDVTALYRRASVVINPCVAGTGLKIKTLEALCHGRRVACWPSGVDGLPAMLADACVVGRDWFEFAQAVVGLLSGALPREVPPEHAAAVAGFVSPARVYRELEQALDAHFAGRVAVGAPAGDSPPPR